MSVIILIIVFGWIAAAVLGIWHGSDMYHLGVKHGRQIEEMESRHERERLRHGL